MLHSRIVALHRLRLDLLDLRLIPLRDHIQECLAVRVFLEGLDQPELYESCGLDHRIERPVRQTARLAWPRIGQLSDAVEPQERLIQYSRLLMGCGLLQPRRSCGLDQCVGQVPCRRALGRSELDVRGDCDIFEVQQNHRLDDLLPRMRHLLLARGEEFSSRALRHPELLAADVSEFRLIELLHPVLVDEVHLPLVDRTELADQLGPFVLALGVREGDERRPGASLDRSRGTLEHVWHGDARRCHFRFLSGCGCERFRFRCHSDFSLLRFPGKHRVAYTCEGYINVYVPRPLQFFSFLPRETEVWTLCMAPFAL